MFNLHSTTQYLFFTDNNRKQIKIDLITDNTETIGNYIISVKNHVLTIKQISIDSIILYYNPQSKDDTLFIFHGFKINTDDTVKLGIFDKISLINNLQNNIHQQVFYKQKDNFFSVILTLIMKKIKLVKYA